MATQKTFTEIVAGQIAAIQARSAGLVDFTIGSVLRAVAESVGMNVLWLQAMVLQTLARARAQTSTGADLDSWMAQFGFIRLPADKAIGEVTFQRFSSAAAVTIAVGATVETTDGTQSFVVTLDAANPAYNGAGGYTMAIGVTSLIVPAEAATAGAAGNVAPGAITVITSTIAGVDKVTNEEVFATGSDAETDPAFRTRFVGYISGLSKGTIAAIETAVTSMAEGVEAHVVENFTYAGAAMPGYFYVVVDDGSGAPSGAFLAQVAAVVEAYRPAGTSFAVYGPVLTTANIALAVTKATGYVSSEVETAVEAALFTYIDALRIGAPLDRNRLFQVAYDASPGVLHVPTLTINGGTADLTADFKHIIRAGTIAATVT